MAGISVAGWMARHYFNIRRLSAVAVVLLPLAFALLVALAWMSAPTPPLRQSSDLSSNPVTTAQIVPIIQARCTGCHANTPTQPGFAAPPAGLVLDTADAIERRAAQIFTAAVVSKTMPIGNLTGMTDAERALLANWYYGRGESETISNPATQ